MSRSPAAARSSPALPSTRRCSSSSSPTPLAPPPSRSPAPTRWTRPSPGSSPASASPSCLPSRPSTSSSSSRPAAGSVTSTSRAGKLRVFRASPSPRLSAHKRGQRSKKRRRMDHGIREMRRLDKSLAERVLHKMESMSTEKDIQF